MSLAPHEKNRPFAKRGVKVVAADLADHSWISNFRCRWIILGLTLLYKPAPLLCRAVSTRLSGSLALYQYLSHYMPEPQILPGSSSLLPSIVLKVGQVDYPRQINSTTSIFLDRHHQIIALIHVDFRTIPMCLVPPGLQALTCASVFLLLSGCKNGQIRSFRIPSNPMDLTISSYLTSSGQAAFSEIKTHSYNQPPVDYRGHTASMVVAMTTIARFPSRHRYLRYPSAITISIQQISRSFVLRLRSIALIRRLGVLLIISPVLDARLAPRRK